MNGKRGDGGRLNSGDCQKEFQKRRERQRDTETETETETEIERDISIGVHGCQKSVLDPKKLTTE